MGDAPGTGTSFEESLQPHPTSVSRARDLVREVLLAAGRDELLENAALVTSELVTNALLHAGTVIDVSGRVDDAGLRLAVRDGGPHMPQPRDYATTSGTGRGLRMLQQIVDDWGVTRHSTGKTVWLLLGTGPPSPDDRADRRTDGAARNGPTDAVTVQLLKMPLLLHTAWQEHAQTMLREYLLARLDADDEDPIATHAEATDAIAVLEEGVPRLHVEMVPDQLMRDVTEPRVTAEQLDLAVPRTSVPSFATLDRVIDAALELESEGVVLTPPTEPEVQSFRRWVCGQVLGQAEGDEPVAWQVPTEDDDELEVPAGWDPQTVTEADRGLLAANLSSHIVAVSRSAAALLGYEPEELAGRRLISIIPERFHQAHVAGFTMYLLVGRKPLLEQTITVPAVRRDGSEIPLQLTVRAHSVGNGESLMLADVLPADV